MQSSLSSGLYISASTNDASSLPPAPTRFLDAPEGRVFTPEQARIFRAVQREDPSDPDQIEAFIKVRCDIDHILSLCALAHSVNIFTLLGFYGFQTGDFDEGRIKNSKGPCRTQKRKKSYKAGR